MNCDPARRAAGRPPWQILHAQARTRQRRPGPNRDMVGAQGASVLRGAGATARVGRRRCEFEREPGSRGAGKKGPGRRSRRELAVLEESHVLAQLVDSHVRGFVRRAKRRHRHPVIAPRLDEDLRRVQAGPRHLLTVREAPAVCAEKLAHEPFRAWAGGFLLRRVARDFSADTQCEPRRKERDQRHPAHDRTGTSRTCE